VPSKILFGGVRRNYGDNIKKDLTEIGWEVVGWSQLAQDRDQ
jgi:hypothetical protein